ncbi:MAG TPA: TRAP transporter small permease [bacterium]|nr:TRAP transporter small permease [bacterium]
MKRIINFLVWVDRLFAASVEALLIVFILGMVALVASQVVLRNFFDSGIDWADLAARNMVLWVAFLGAMLATRSRSHIAIDVLTRFMPRVPRNALRVVLDAFSCGISLLLAHAALAFVMDEKAGGALLFEGMPVWAAMCIIPFGFAMISLEYAIGIGLDIWRIFKSGSAGFEAGRGRG